MCFHVKELRALDERHVIALGARVHLLAKPSKKHCLTIPLLYIRGAGGKICSYILHRIHCCSVATAVYISFASFASYNLPHYFGGINPKGTLKALLIPTKALKRCIYLRIIPFGTCPCSKVFPILHKLSHVLPLHNIPLPHRIVWSHAGQPPTLPLYTSPLHSVQWQRLMTYSHDITFLIIPVEWHITFTHSCRILKLPGPKPHTLVTFPTSITPLHFHTSICSKHIPTA